MFPPTPSAWRAALLSSLLALAAGVTVLGNGLCLDGRAFVEENPIVRSVRSDPGALWDLLAKPYWADAEERQALWRPLSSLSFGVTYLAFGGTAWPYHAFVLLTHALCAGLVALFAHRLLGKAAGALVAAALFASHPIHAEVLGDTVGRAETLAALFGLAGLLLYAKVEKTRDRRFAAALGCFFLATLAKETAFSLALLAPLYDLFLRPGEGTVRERVRRAFPRWLLLGIPFGLHLALRAAVLGSLAPSFTPINRLDNPLLFEPARWRIANALRLMAYGMRLLVWPHPLSADYSLDQIAVLRSLRDPSLLAGIAVVAAALVGAALGLRRRSPSGYAAIFLLVAWLPSSNLLFGAGTIFAERALYLPSVGACVLAAALFLRVARSAWGARLAWAGLALLASAGLARTNARLRDWRDDLHLWEVTAKRDAPRSARAHGAYARRLHEQGRRDEALAELQRSLDLYPDYYHVHGKIAEIRRGEGDLRGAVEAMLRALRGQIRLYGTRSPDAPAFLYSILRDLQSVPDGAVEAERTFRALLEEGFDTPYLRAYLAEALAARGAVEEAEEQYRHALSGRVPPVVRASHAVFLLGIGRIEEANAEAAAVGEGAPALARHRAGLVQGEVAWSRRLPERAFEAFDRILAEEEIDPGITVRARLGRGLAGADLGLALRAVRPDVALGKLRASRQDLEAALARANLSGPQETMAVSSLASVLTNLGEVDAAGDLLEKAVESRPQDESLRLLLVGLEAGRGRISAALRHLAVLRQGSPSDARLMIWEGELCLSVGEAAGALELAKTAMPTASGSKAAAKGLLGRAEVALGRTEEGLEILRALARERPSDPTAAVWLGLALLDAGRVSEGHREILRATEGPRRAEDPAAFDALARIHGGFCGAEGPKERQTLDRLRDPRAAARLSDEALRLAPGDPRYLKTRALLHRAAGEEAAAREVLRRALDLAVAYSPSLREELEGLLAAPASRGSR